MPRFKKKNSVTRAALTDSNPAPLSHHAVFKPPDLIVFFTKHKKKHFFALIQYKLLQFFHTSMHCKESTQSAHCTVVPMAN